MSADEVIAEIESLPKDEQTRVLEHFQQPEDSEIPESFRRAMAQAAAEQWVDMEIAMTEVPPSRAQ